MSRILIAGCGFIGTRLGELLAREGHDVIGLRRDPSGLPGTITPLAADLGDPATLRELPRDLHAVFYTAAAASRDPAAYRLAYADGVAHLLLALRARDAETDRPFIAFTSSTGVYPQADGSWVDEDSECGGADPATRALLDGEALVLRSGFPATVVRVAGIYGPGRTRLLEQVREGRAEALDDPPHWTNRIHRDDCAGVLHHLLTLDAARRPRIVNAVDDEPALQGDVVRWLARELGVEEPRATRGHARGSNKRVRNLRLRESGYTLRYPSWREGYGGLIGR